MIAGVLHRDVPPEAGGLSRSGSTIDIVTTNAAPKNKRRELGEQSREVILDVATRLMSARGYDGTSISAIAAESGLPASSIYWHFSSKVGVLTAVMNRGSERFYADAATFRVPTTGSLFDKVLAVYEHGVRSLEANPDFIRLQVILMLHSPAGDVIESIAQMRVRQRDGIRAILAEALADLGDVRANEAAANLADFAGASFDGIILARESDSADVHGLLRQLARATVALAEAEPVDEPRRAKKS